MFGELPKLFDRNFAVGFFLPVAIFIAISGIIISQYGFAPQVATYTGTNLLVGTTVLGLLAWIGGIVLLALNRPLYRILEGYEKFNPIQLFIRFEQKRYAEIKKELKPLNAQFRKLKKENKKLPTKDRLRRIELTEKLAAEFPDQEDFFLATPFGNVLRSFEVYPRVMYGLEAIYAWERLLAVIPKDYLELIDSAKAQVDLWVNLGFVFILLQVEYVAFVYTFGKSLNLWVVALFIILGTFALMGATSAAKEWGRFVKSAFDMFIPKLRETLGFDQSKSREEEMQQWADFTQAIVYRRPKRMPARKKPAEKEPESIQVYQSSLERSSLRRRRPARKISAGRREPK